MLKESIPFMGTV